MTTTVPGPGGPVRWKTASPNGDSCVEVAHTFGAVRDSKHPTSVLTNVDVRMLVDMVHDGRFDR